MHPTRHALTMALCLCSWLTAADADDGAAVDRPLWCVPTVTIRPDAGRLLLQPLWPEAAALTGFCQLGSGLLSHNQPQVWLARDEQRLVIAWHIDRVNGQELVARCRQRDGAVWEDDAFEVFLDPGHTHKGYYQFIINAAGTVYDSYIRDASWSAADLTVRTAQDASGWAGVMAVPFAAFGAPPADGVDWAANFGVDRTPGQRPDRGWEFEGPNLTWAPVSAGFHEPAAFGHLRFAREGVVQLRSLGEPWWRAPRFAGRSVGRAEAKLAGAVKWDSHSNGGVFDWRPAELAPGAWQTSFEVTAGGRRLARWQGRFAALPLLEPRVQTLGVSRMVEVDARIQCAAPPRQTAVAVDLLDGRGKLVRRGTLKLTHNRSDRPLCWSMATMTQPAYRFLFRVQPWRPFVGGRDFSVPEQELTWVPPAKPAWLGSSAGRGNDEDVLRGWTPLSLEQHAPLSFGCWARRYTLAPSGLPASITALDQELLAAPAQWQAAVGGQPVTWQAEPTRLLRATPGVAEYTARQSGGGLRLTTRGRLEFDGFLKLRVRLEPTAGPVDLSQWRLHLPFRREVARLLHHFPKPPVWTGFDPAKINARAVPADGWQAPFLYHVWVGDESKGLQWLTETDEGWQPANPERAIELRPDGAAMDLVLDVIGQRTRLTAPREVVFALQASPVKPRPANWRHWRYTQAGWYGMEKATHPAMRPDSRVTWPAAGHLNLAQGTLEVTVRPKFDSSPSGQPNRQLWTLFWSDDERPEPTNGAWFYWNLDDKGLRVVFRQDDRYTVIYGGRMPWRPGEAHTVAFTWGPEQRIYYDGVAVAQYAAGPMFSKPMDLRRAIMSLGAGDSEFVVRQIRVSSVVRPPEQLGRGDQRLEADEQTLLLDRLDQVTGRRTRPARAAAGAVGTIGPGAARVDQGLDLTPPAPHSTHLDYLKKVGVRTMGFHEHWSEWQGFPRTARTQELQSLLAGCRERELRMLLYHSWQLSDTAPEYASFLRECEIVDPARFLYTRQPQQTDYPVCPHSAWVDFMADGLQRLFRDYAPDGIYSDGLSYPGECSNALHGCGWTDADGRRHPTLPIFATREAMKRFRRILDDQGGERLFIAHTSGQITLPTLSFADAYLDAEHLTGQPRPFRLSLDSFRAEFMGHNYGLPAYFLCYDWNQGLTTPEGLAISLLHDTELPWSFEAMAPIWDLWDRFGVDQCEFLPYWQAERWLASAPAGVKVSAYRRADGHLLVVAANLTEREVSGAIRLRQPLRSAKEALAGRAMPVTDGAVTDQFPPWRARLYGVATR